MQCLIMLGASINAKGMDTPPPLFIAALKGHVGAVRILLEAGAALEGDSKVPGSGRSALMAAAKEGSEEVVHVLLLAGADFRGVGEAVVNGSRRLKHVVEAHKVRVVG